MTKDPITNLLDKKDEEITRLRAQLAEVNTALDNALIVGPQTTLDSYSNPKEAFDALINWEVDVALDPRVSERARKLAEVEGQEPVAEITNSGLVTTLSNMNLPAGTKLYTHPAPAKVPDKLTNAIEHYKWCMENEVCSSIRYESKITYDTLCYVEAMLKSQGGE